MKLGGSTFVYNGIKQDYCFIETLNCLYDLCDWVSVAYGGTDGTVKAVEDWASNKRNVIKIWFSEDHWHSKKGREKLSYFSNLAIEALPTDWNFYLQSDEILHENCFPAVRAAILSEAHGHLVTRYNLWGSPYTVLNVPQERKPCSTEVIRLARSQYRCIDDAESLGVMGVSGDYLNDIRIYHMGFVRDSVKHLVKIRHIQDDVFLIDHDKRIDGMEKFDPWKFFSTSDVIPIHEEGLPKYIKQWAYDRSSQ